MLKRKKRKKKKGKKREKKSEEATYTLGFQARVADGSRAHAGGLELWDVVVGDAGVGGDGAVDATLSLEHEVLVAGGPAVVARVGQGPCGEEGAGGDHQEAREVFHLGWIGTSCVYFVYVVECLLVGLMCEWGQEK